MPILHKILRGDQAGLYLPFGLSRLRALVAIHGEEDYFAEKYSVGGYSIEVSQIAPFQYVRITQSGGPAYEFFTSDHLNDSSLGSPDHSNGITDTYSCGSATRTTFPVKGLTRSQALYSSTLTGPWKPRDCEAVQGGDTGLYTWRAWQNQKFFEHAWHPNNDGKSLVTSTQAQAPGLAGQCNWMSPYAFTRLASAGSKVSDFGPDVFPTIYSGASLASGAPDLPEEWVYWRRAAVQSAGGRLFFISTDSYGRFQVYPVKNYVSTGNRVPVGSYKQYTPPYPDWVTVPDPEDYRWQVNDWLWRFNKDATKCVSIPYNSDFSNGFYKTLNDEQFFATIFPDEVPYFTPANSLVPAHEDTPGLVEFGITITVTGDGDMDFDVAFTLLRNSYFADDGRFYFDAAYFMKDVENIGIAEDTLMTAEMECSYPSGHYTAATAETPEPYYIDLIKNVEGSVVINANDNTMMPTEKLRVPIWGPINFKFPTLAAYLSVPASPYHDVLSGGIGGTVTVNGHTFVQASAGPVNYEPELDGGGQGIGAKTGSIWALELSTLSILYEVDDSVSGQGQLRGLSHGQEFYNLTFDMGFTRSPSALPAADTRVPTARIHQYVLDNVINTEWGQGFNVHPAGHWSFAVNAQLGTNTTIADSLDWISVKETDGTRTRYRHKDLFNSAFAQTRDYDFYTAPFVGKGLWDQGSFRTQGIWATFR